MKVATIVPERFLKLIDKQTYHMVLAHLVKPTTDYTEFYKSKAEDLNSFVIMDNGAAENSQLEVMELVQRARYLNPDEIIVPDTLRDYKSTVAKARKYLQYIRNSLPSTDIMVVPQGRTLDEYLTCAEMLIQMDIDTIGVSKFLNQDFGDTGRLSMLYHLQRLLYKYGKQDRVQFHALGCAVGTLEAKLLRDVFHIRGIDSVLAYDVTRVGDELGDGVTRPNLEVDFLWKETEVDKQLLGHNIRVWQGVGYKDAKLSL